MNPDLPAACLTALLHASLVIGGGWVFLLLQGKASAALRSLTGRLTMAAALILTAFQIFPALPFPVLSGPPAAPATASLPQGSGLITGSLLTNPTAEPSGKNPTPVLPANTRNSAVPNHLDLPARASLTLITLWLAGALAVLLRWAASLIHRQRLLTGSGPAGDIFQTLPDLAKIPGWTMVNDVRLLPGNITPCVWGIRKTTLALPCSAATWPAGKLRLVLAHECAHLLRRDPLWQVIARSFLALFWFHPLAWNLARRVRAADEQAADDRVLTTTPDAPSYAALLVECARQFSQPRATRATITAMANSANLTHRVEAILSQATDRRTATPRSFLTPSVFLLAMATAVVSQAPAIATAQPAPGPTATPVVIDQTPSPSPSPSPSPPPPPTAPSGVEESDIAEHPSKLLDKGTLKITGDTFVVPAAETSADRKTLQITGSVKLSSAKLNIEADQIVVSSSNIDNNFLILSANGNITIQGTVGKSTITAVAEELWISNKTGEMTLTGWPKVNVTGMTFKAQKPSAKILLKGGVFSCEGCMVITPADQTDPNSSALPLNIETPQHKKDITPADFPWKVETIDGVESVSLQQVSDYYHFDGVTVQDDGTFQLNSKVLNIKGKSGSADLLINGVRFILNHPISKSKDILHVSREDLSNVIDPVLRPSKIQGATPLETVVIDAGHGGKDSGAVNAMGKESDYTLDTALRLKKALEEAGHKTILTRSSDATVSLADRRNLADNTKNAIFVSLHFNHGQGGNQGIQTFLPESTNLDSISVRTSMALATAIHSHLLLNTRSQDGGIQGANFFLLRNEPVNPSVMVDGGYLSHPGDAAKIADASYRESLAQGIAKGIFAYAKSVR